MGLIGRIIVDEPDQSPAGLVIGLPGRGLPVHEMYRFLLHANLNQSIISVIEPRNLEWYPQPFGIENQADAIEGCKKGVKSIIKVIKNLCRMYKIPYNRLAIVGYSAGAVMALEIAQVCKKELAMFISIAGTVLDPKGITPAKHNTSIVIKHCRDDDCFDWHERYEPTRDALIKNKYNLILEERYFGGHNLSYEDAHIVNKFISEKLSY